MKKMKKYIAIIALVLCLAIGAGVTYAYFTASVRTHNVITSGKVAVELVELGEDGEDFKDIEGAMPGVKYAKIVRADNVGSADAWIRMKLDRKISPASGVTAELDPSLIGLHISPNNGWVEKDGWYYYESALLPGESSKPLLSSVSLAEDMGNEWQSATVEVIVTMEAVQVANNGTTVFQAQGWPNT